MLPAFLRRRAELQDKNTAHFYFGCEKRQQAVDRAAETDPDPSARPGNANRRRARGLRGNTSSRKERGFGTYSVSH